MLTQLLATSRQCIAISEAPVVDSALQLCLDDVHGERGIKLLQDTVRALGQRRSGDEECLVLKLDAWHITHVPNFRRAFPKAKFYFLYRNPAEILASHRRERGPHMVPGLIDPERLGLESHHHDPADLDAFCLKVLSSFFRSAGRFSESEQLQLVNFNQLPDFAWTDFARAISMDLDANSIRLMRERARYHAKHPYERFAGSDAEAPAPRSSGHLGDAEALYQALEETRLAQASAD